MNMKQEIIRIVEQMKDTIGENALRGLFDSGDRATGEKRVGCNQFREIASDCRYADCYEEIVLLVRYTQAKSKRGESWKKVCANREPFGEVVVDGMNRVKGLCGTEDWEKIREPLQLFFGYLYWQSRIWSDQYAQQNGGNPGVNHAGNTQGNQHNQNHGNNRRQ